jgi:antitoxin CptB
MDTKKLRWRARRGMRELDVLLTRFLDNQFGETDAATQRRFESLLEHDDPQLYSWLTRRQLHSDPDMQDLITRIISEHTG